MNCFKSLVIGWVVMLAATSCSKLDVFEQSVFFGEHEWKSSNKPSFTFEISDTTKAYNVFLVLRHEDAYRYKNIWLDIKVQQPDTTFVIKREFNLADNARWLGTGMDDIIEHRISFNKQAVGLPKGKYTFTLTQVMREDPLQHILNAGIRVEKVGL